ncbi:GntR family transcriptional regulator [Actinotalea sp.]|uniref:GntR family transcriptional regulator n=1 Tax=Actinotalea sp. TaxID=1872145 RepID=UPI003569FDA6
MPRLSRVLLRDEALAAIRASIVRGDLAPGQVIKDAELASTLGLSVAPVRSALSRLVDEGLVESKPQSHTRVTPVRPKDVRDAVVVVRAMHEIAAREAASRLTDDDLATMRDANQRFADAVSTGDVDAALSADDELHGVLLARCENAAVRATVERFTPLIRRLERQRFGAPHGQDSIALHEALVDTCRTEPELAVAVTTTIWSTLLEELDETVEATAPDETRTPPAPEEPA